VGHIGNNDFQSAWFHCQAIRDGTQYDRGGRIWGLVCMCHLVKIGASHVNVAVRDKGSGIGGEALSTNIFSAHTK